jgi:hypothetical protein
MIDNTIPLHVTSEKGCSNIKLDFFNAEHADEAIFLSLTTVEINTDIDYPMGNNSD